MKRDFNTFSANDNNTYESSDSENSNQSFDSLDSDTAANFTLKNGVFKLNLKNIDPVYKYLNKNLISFEDIATPFRKVAYLKIDEINQMHFDPVNDDFNAYINKIKAIKREALKMHFSETYPILQSLKLSLTYLNIDKNDLDLQPLIQKEIFKIQQIQDYLLKHEKVTCHNCIYSDGKMLFIKKF